MANFHYQALNDKRQLVAGEVQADSVAQALARLEAEGLVVQAISYASAAVPPVPARITTPRERAVREPDLSAEAPLGTGLEQDVLRTHLASLLQRGPALAPALRAFAEEMPAGLERRQLNSVWQVLERGDPAEATTALTALPEFWIPLLSAATAAHDPGRVLHEFLTESQRATELRRQWWQALAYPLIVTGLALVVLVLLSFLVVPVFRDIFREFALQLPGVTVFILELAAWITSGRILIVAFLVSGGVLLLVKLCRLLPARMRIWFSDRFGTPLGRATALARFAQFSADLLEAGLPAPSALRIAGYSTRSLRLRRAAWRLAREIESGGGPTSPTRREPLSWAVVHVLRSEMPAAARIHLLREVGRSRAERGAMRLSWTRGVIEPVAICVIGGMVGAVALALFLPLFKLLQALSS